MDIELQLSSTRYSDDSLQQVCRDLCALLNDEADLSARLPETGNVPGSRGDPVTIGAIIMTVFTSGAATALFGVLRSFFERDRSLDIRLKREDGREFRLRAQNLDPDSFESVLGEAKAFMGV